MSDLRSAGAGKPDVTVVHPAIQITAPLMLDVDLRPEVTPLCFAIPLPTGADVVARITYP